MADNPTQDGRTGRLATPLGKDKLCLTRFEGTEAMGELFEFRIEAVSPDANIDFNKALGRNCSVHLETADNSGRDFSGILTEAQWVGTRLDLHALSARPSALAVAAVAGASMPHFLEHVAQGHHQASSGRWKVTAKSST